MSEKILLNDEQLQDMIADLSNQVMEKFSADKESLALVGIQRRGATLSKRMKKHIDKAWGSDILMGTLDITLYRDDLSTYGSQPNVRSSQIPFDVKDKIIILTDDVLYTGRTIRSALNAIVDYGRPKRIVLLVLVDRGWRELPIQADFAGLTVDTAGNQIIHVHHQENDGEENVVLHTND